MACLFDHNWSWPRRRGGKDVQFCPNCGAERVSKVHFDGPRYRRTQDAIPNFIAPPFQIDAHATADEADGFASMAA
ncbi:MAG: hypothetical protein ABSH46_08120 [Bryobacteraceae bacterium]|jgi:hypothetical protein